MTRIARAVERYVALRRALGYRLAGAGMLRDFARFLEQQGAVHVTTSLALAWATRPSTARPGYWASRLCLVRRFAAHLSASDPRSEVPPPGLVRVPCRRTQPHCYSEDEIRRILQAAHRIRSKTGLHAKTYPALIGLLIVTGLRSGEAVALDDEDVNLRDGVLTIRQTKFRKSRLVPLHPSTVQALRRYMEVRDALMPRGASHPLFVGETGRRLPQNTLEWRFRKLCRAARVQGRDGRRAPHLHDFRHRLAVETLVEWYRRGADVEAHLPALSTYLGHARISDTYWYLSATPELLRLVTERLEQREGQP